MNHADIVAALQTNYPGSHWAITGDNLDDLIWLDASPKPTAAELGL
jgi:hypothetical protein